jgi:hypothetical protein
MVADDGTVVIDEDEAGTSVIDAAQTRVQYAFDAVQVGTAGTYWGWFLAEDATGNKQTFPSKEGSSARGFQIVLNARA